MIYKKIFGEEEKIIPSMFKRVSRIDVLDNDEKFSNLKMKVTDRGTQLTLSLDENENIFGFGLQMKEINRTYGKMFLRIQADPTSNSGESHAAVPYFVTNTGKAYVFDTARNVTLYLGNDKKQYRSTTTKKDIAIDTHALYDEAQKSDKYQITVEIPVCKGVGVYYIEAKDMLSAVQEYNLLSGGGCLPAKWGLGVYYRCFARYNQEQVIKMAEYFREKDIPCDVIGLEPGWQSHAYSCSHKWEEERFPDSDGMLQQLAKLNFNVNLWEHAFCDASSPMYDDLFEKSADFEVWKGLVPDFIDENAREIYANYHKKLVAQGVSGFKLDECDNSDNTGGWSFPDLAQFPSGCDGEQFHNLFGVLYQQTILDALGEQETFSQVRSTHLFSAPYPFVLYSDLYEIQDFLTAQVNAGFSGMLWSPELRDVKTKEELLLRLQILCFSAQFIINAWYIDGTPWQELDAEKETREILKLRMSLIPYLYAAFYRYHTQGKPLIRALVVDYPTDKETYYLRDEYMFGDNILVAPYTDLSGKRKVYLPEGEWYSFFTKQKYGSGYVDFKDNNLPVFVKKNTIIPLSEPNNFASDDSVYKLTIYVFGDEGVFTLFDKNVGEVVILYKNGSLEIIGDIAKSKYQIKEVVRII